MTEPRLDNLRVARRDVGRQPVCLPGGVTIGGGDSFTLFAGPCSVESEDQIQGAARLATSAGAKVLRGGAFKPRTSPYSFRGLGEEGLKMMRQAADDHHLAMVTEVLHIGQVDTVAKYSDMLQVGSRNMQNFELLEAVGGTGMPVLLKRGLAATVEETLMAAEYIALAGSEQIVLCERGIRTFETSSRNTLDLNSALRLQALSCLPVIADPSHGTGRREMVVPMALATRVLGLDGVMVEIHPEPDAALSDGSQSLDAQGLDELTRKLALIPPEAVAQA
ncbi:MAG TPA: 3-deoxy-7-phosphoheptulonate synthase [Myxococcales bacterium]|nr:3-deoxy-7-phosphoheptulonate synthase [Myxococcales bacterium]HBU47498.1 3-deoxy-7-phosphoheptulonate synthase [Myxococcales bacterium]